MSTCRQLVLVTLVAVTTTVPEDSTEVLKILRDQRSHQGNGNYNLDVETNNGIILALSGSPVGPAGTVTNHHWMDTTHHLTTKQYVTICS